MKFNIIETKISIKKFEGNKKHDNLLASATVILKEEAGSYLGIGGITIWISKINDKINVEPPKNRFFKHCFGTIWEKIRKEIVREYEYCEIPVIEEKSSL